MTEPVFVACKWLDAWADTHESVSIEDAHLKHNATLMETRGWLLVDNEKGVSLFNERCLDVGDGTYRGRTFVPRAMIQSVIPVVKARKPRSTKLKVAEAPKAPPHTT